MSLLKAPRISVLMGVARVDDYLRIAIDSVLSQTFGDFEFIIVCNGPAAGGVEDVQSITDDPRVRVMAVEIGQLSFALNTALCLSRGEFVARMDADDISSPERFARQLAALDADPGLSVVGSQVEYIDSDGRPTGARSALPCDSASIRNRQFYEGCLVHPSVMIRREVLVRAGGYLGGKTSQDLDLWLRMRRDGVKFGNVDSVLLKYRKHDAQESGVRVFRGVMSETSGLFFREFVYHFDPRFLGGVVRALGFRIVAAMLGVAEKARSSPKHGRPRS